jgi:hypothetical protein
LPLLAVTLARVGVMHKRRVPQSAAQKKAKNSFFVLQNEPISFLPDGKGQVVVRRVGG